MKPNWIGRQFETVIDNGDKCVALMGTNSMVYTPVKVKPRTVYEIEFLAKKESGNGRFFTNLYGGAKFDFQQRIINCSEKWRSYKVKISTGAYPVTQPISFRMWKDKNSTGTTLIKRIKVSFLESSVANHKIIPRPIPRTPTINKHNPVERPVHPVTQLKMGKRYNGTPRQQKVSPQARVIVPNKTIIKPSFSLTKFNPRPFVKHFPNNSHNVKVLYLPANNEQIKQTGVEDAFIDAGFQLCSFDFRNCYNNTNKNNCINTLRHTVKSYKPDWIHMQLQYTGFIPAEILSTIKQENPNTLITNWSGDVRDHPNIYFVECGKQVDLSLFCNKGQLPMFRKKGLNIDYWQIGIDPKQTFRMSDDERAALRKIYNHDIAFCASYTTNFPDSELRTSCVLALSNKFGKRFGLYGGNWGHITSSFRGPLPYYQQNKVYSGSKIAISINHFNNINKYFSDRQLLTMGSGTLTLCHYIPGLEEYFENGKDCVWFKSVPECIEMAQYYLKHPKEADQIGRNGAEKVKNEHSYLSRVKELSKKLHIVPEIKNPAIKPVVKPTTKEEKINNLDLSIVLGTHNRLELLKKVVNSASRSANGCNYEIIINDASSTDGTVAWLKNVSAKNKRIVSIFGEKKGITKAYNECFEKARGKFLIWLSDDTIAVGKALFNMFNLMKNTKENMMGAFETRNFQNVQFQIPTVGPLLMPIVGCVHKSYIKKLGYWNMDYPYYGQDSEWNARIYRSGGSIMRTSEKVDHLNCQDDLKSTNLESYKKDGFFDKYRIFYSHRFGKRSKFLYPIILLNIQSKNTEYGSVKELVSNIRKFYKNIYFATLPEFGLKLSNDFPNIEIIGEAVKKNDWDKYDLIINMNDKVRRMLNPNGVFITSPFSRSLMNG